jgi:MFS family permease
MDLHWCLVSIRGTGFLQYVLIFTRSLFLFKAWVIVLRSVSRHKLQVRPLKVKPYPHSAPSMDFLIFGRAVAGIGASGIYVANTVIIADITTLEQRPKFLG